MKHRRISHWAVVLAILLIALLFRVWLISGERVSFDSDEAVVGLMARHIVQGKSLPTFFYGQAYMGSLDAFLVAGGFALLGESVDTIRLVQLVLYLGTLLSAYLLARSVTQSRRVGLVTLLLLAVPTALGALYTTISLGGYNEAVIAGNFVLLLGWQVTVQKRTEYWRWAMLGFVSGVGWWVNGAIVTACLVVMVLGLRRSMWSRPQLILLAGVCFLIGSAPWWVYNVQHDWAALDFLFGGFESGPSAERMSFGETLLGLLLLGVPALYGLRVPWSSTFTLSVGWLAAVLVYLVLVTDWIAGVVTRRQIVTPRAHTRALRWVLLVLGVFTLVFIFSSFSDATGRYLMPVWVPAAIGIAIGIDRLRRAGWAVASLGLGVLVMFQAGSVIRAAETDTGLTPQLVEELRVPAEYDQALIDFMLDEEYYHGYASYWTSFRLMFRTHETIIFDTALPYLSDGLVEGNDRYAPYGEQVANADHIVWITQDLPELDAVIVAGFKSAGIKYETTALGPYRVYHDLSTRISPADLGVDWNQPLENVLVELTADKP